ncbi:MAG TPA: signal peptidase II [Gemmatimonas sp.]|nr:signal peptidase II [Gemmatimonas sp.]
MAHDSAHPTHAAPGARSSFTVFVLVAITTMLADVVSKEAATVALANDRVVPLLERLSLFLVYNTGSAGGVMIGRYTWHLNVLATAAAIMLITSVANALIAVDRRATLALGLVAGGAAGNLASMLFGPAGVADFLAIQLAGDTTIVVNVADLALWGGALMLVPVAASLVSAIRVERRGERRTGRAYGYTGVERRALVA